MERAKSERKIARMLFSRCGKELEEAIENRNSSELAALLEKLQNHRTDLLRIQNNMMALWLDVENRDEAEFETDMETADSYEKRWFLLKQKVISSVSEPEPGWLVGWSGINGIVNAAMTGTLNCAYADPNVIIDIIPVDYTANLIIASAWDVSVTRARGDKNIKVFNCCSGMQNPITVNYLMSATVGLNRRNNKDMKAGIWFVNQKRPLFYYIQLYLLNIMPAIFQDFTSFLFGKSRRNYKAVQKLAQLMYFLHYFCINEFLFIDRNVQRLYNSMSKTDRALFNFDVKSVRWMETLNNFTIGLHRISGRIRKE